MFTRAKPNLGIVSASPVYSSRSPASSSTSSFPDSRSSTPTSGLSSIHTDKDNFISLDGYYRHSIYTREIAPRRSISPRLDKASRSSSSSSIQTEQHRHSDHLALPSPSDMKASAFSSGISSQNIQAPYCIRIIKDRIKLDGNFGDPITPESLLKGIFDFKTLSTIKENNLYIKYGKIAENILKSVVSDDVISLKKSFNDFTRQLEEHQQYGISSHLSNLKIHDQEVFTLESPEHYRERLIDLFKAPVLSGASATMLQEAPFLEPYNLILSRVAADLGFAKVKGRTGAIIFSKIDSCSHNIELNSFDTFKLKLDYLRASFLVFEEKKLRKYLAKDKEQIETRFHELNYKTLSCSVHIQKDKWDKNRDQAIDNIIGLLDLSKKHEKVILAGDFNINKIQLDALIISLKNFSSVNKMVLDLSATTTVAGNTYDVMIVMRHPIKELCSPARLDYILNDTPATTTTHPATLTRAAVQRIAVTAYQASVLTAAAVLAGESSSPPPVVTAPIELPTPQTESLGLR